MAVKVKGKIAAVPMGRDGGKNGESKESKDALHLCLGRIKEAKSESELRRLTEELQKIVFRRQYQNASD
jgi:hypothetical protein